MDHLLGHIFHDRRRHPTRREVVARLLLSALSMAVASLSLTATNTYTALMLVVGGNVSILAVIVLGGLGLFLFTDTLVNEVWPHERLLPRITGWRTYLWLTAGLIHELFAYLVFSSHLSVSLGAFLAIFGWGCFALTFVDAAQEKADPARCPT